MTAAPDSTRPPTHPGTGSPPTRPPQDPPPPPPPTKALPQRGHLPIGAPSHQPPPAGGVRAGGPPAPGAGAKPVMPQPRSYLGFDVESPAELVAAINRSLGRRAL